MSQSHLMIDFPIKGIREPLDTYFAYGDASVQDIKACARRALLAIPRRAPC